MTPLHILGISGSLRKNSYNTAALRAAMNLLPGGATMEIFDLAPILLYNEDVREQGLPQPVEQFREKIAAAAAVLIATPKYNYSIPGTLKNAIDWASRPPSQPLNNKPNTNKKTTPGAFGTARAQYH